MYRMKGRVRYSECGPDNKLTLSGLINYFQDCTSENSELLGVGVEYMKMRQKAWVVFSWQIEVERYPVCCEDIVVETWATGFRGIMGPRDFCMRTADGEILAKAKSMWVFVDGITGKPAKPEQGDLELYTIGEPQEMEQVSKRIEAPKELILVDTFPVRKYHIDTNNHVNNVQYILMAEGVLPDDYKADRIRVEYKNPAVMGDDIVLKYVDEGDRIVVHMCDKDDKIFVIVEFRGEA